MSIPIGVAGLVSVDVLVRTTRTDSDGRPERDSRGNAVLGVDRVRVDGCSWQQPGGTENVTEDRDEVIDTGVLIAPWWPETADDALAGVEVLGRRYEVRGSPRRQLHPRLGHVSITLEEVRG